MDRTGNQEGEREEAFNPTSTISLNSSEPIRCPSGPPGGRKEDKETLTVKRIPLTSDRLCPAIPPFSPPLLTHRRQGARSSPPPPRWRRSWSGARRGTRRGAERPCWWCEGRQGGSKSDQARPCPSSCLTFLALLLFLPAYLLPTLPPSLPPSLPSYPELVGRAGDPRSPSS